MTPRRTAAAAEPPEIRPNRAKTGKESKAAPITWQTASCRATSTGWLFTLPVPERTNAIWRSWKGRTLISAKHRQDKQTAPIRFAGCQPLAGDVTVSMTWFRERRAGDVDGRIKAALDLLRGIAYADDRQVAELRIVRRDESHQPARLEILVEPCHTTARAA